MLYILLMVPKANLTLVVVDVDVDGIRIIVVDSPMLHPLNLRH